MVIDVEAKSVCKIDIDEVEAFRMLCKTLCMECVLEDSVDFFVKQNEFGENCVYHENNPDEVYDDRGDLFVALRNVAVNMFPNLYFRSEKYIYDEDNIASVIRENAVDEGYLQNWYQDSVTDDPPTWTDEHIKEVHGDFYLIPKELVDESGLEI